MRSSPPSARSISLKTTGTYYNSSHVTPLEREGQRSVADDLFGCVIGEMPRPEFLDKFLPAAPEPLGPIEDNFFSTLPERGEEVDRYPHFVSLYSLHPKFSLS